MRKRNVNMRNVLLLGATALFITMLISCKKFVQVPSPAGTIVTSAVFADSADAVSAIVGIYSTFEESTNTFDAGNGLVTICGGLSADEISSGANQATELDFYSDNVLATNTYVTALWQQFYAAIYQANACLEGVPASSGLSSSLKNQLIGEAKFIRAFMYFNLVNLYGGVPLVVSTDYSVNEQLPRAEVDSVYAQMVSDLTDARNLLTTSYVTSGRVRPNKYTASSLLAKVYLYTGQWSKADSLASEVITSGIYSLDPSLSNIFAAGSNEAIFQFQTLSLNTSIQTTQGYEFVPSAANVIPNYVVSSYLLNAFDAGDQRRVAWLDSSLVNGVAYYYPFKYEVGNSSNGVARNENFIIFRLGELYLIRADAKAQENDLTGSLADINAIRTRAGLNSIVSVPDQASLEDSILHERQIELFCEWGNRWFDLKRTGNANSVLGIEKKGWNTDAVLYPIPSTQLMISPFLTQNPGY